MDLPKLMIEAYRVATRSHDPSTQNGAVIIWLNEVMAYGWNHIPDLKGRVLINTLADRDLKYPRVIHAEVDAIAYAAKNKVCTDGLTMVCPWASCVSCLPVIIRSGLKKLVVHGPRMRKGHPLGWTVQVDEAWIRLQNAGIECEVLDIELPNAPAIRIHEKLWQP